ncbi:hypothetical protein [Trichloromonas sp.]|uniref:hypothetical protein n=1 Tax=Trichloromonas sp. TaxID=3069249 RepID=UPI002A394E99|nr:hypothetical protein [Trichloromonas sp.]
MNNKKKIQEQRIRNIKSKYYSRIKSLFNKSLGKDGDVFSKIDEIDNLIKECEKEIRLYKNEHPSHIQTFESFTK